MDDEEKGELSFSLQSVSALIEAKKAFIDNKGNVDMGDVKEVTLGTEGILKVKIKGSRTATVTMAQVFDKAEDAYEVAIKLKAEQKQNLSSDINAMRGRIENIRNPQD